MKTAMTLMVLALLAGCMSYREARVGALGETVYAVHRQQIADPARAASPGADISPTGIDGAQMETVLESYRSVKGDAGKVAQPIQIQVGN